MKACYLRFLGSCVFASVNGGCSLREPPFRTEDRITTDDLQRRLNPNYVAPDNIKEEYYARIDPLTGYPEYDNPSMTSALIKTGEYFIDKNLEKGNVIYDLTKWVKRKGEIIEYNFTWRLMSGKVRSGVRGVDEIFINYSVEY